MTDTRPDLAAIKDGHWLAHGEWVAEYCVEQPEEPEPLFRVLPEANAPTVARIHNDMLAEVERLTAIVAEVRALVAQRDARGASWVVRRVSALTSGGE